MRIVKEPVYVGDDPYKIVIGYRKNTLHVKFYKPNRIFRCKSYWMGDFYKDVINYPEIAKRFVERFEKDLEKERMQVDLIKEFEEWDGR